MPRSKPRPLPLIAALLFLGPTVAASQTANSVTIPPLADSTRARIGGEVTTPPGFTTTIFAAPPHLTYPTVVHPAGDGVVFAATDPNLLFGRERYLGRLLRFVDDDGDGVADRYTLFADSLDSVRGITVDGADVYVMHAPTLAAYRDVDGDGIADEKRVLVEGLGFGLDDRNGDHTSNGIRLGLDGWLYVAVGDYGFLAATGTDGRQIHLHGGGVVRVRPDGTELEIVARGTRNIYDLALDPHLRIFTRDNNNNGQHWNSVFHYLPVGANAGYPSLFRNFAEEIHPVLADYGAGAATTTLWVDEPGFPAPLRRGLLSADWALNRIYHHSLTPSGGTFEISQEEIMTIPRPVDLEVSPEGDLFVASLSGGSYDYAGEHVGYILRLSPADRRAPPPSLRDAAVDRLLDALLAGSYARRLSAQRELLRHPPSQKIRQRLEDALLEPALPPSSRIAALFTLKQMQGEDSHDLIVRAAADPDLREAALRALVDRREELDQVPLSLYTEGLKDPDPLVRLQAVRGIARLVPPGAADLLMEASTDPEETVAHVARNEAAALGAGAAGAALRALDGGDEAATDAALQVLSRLHSPTAVSELARRVTAAEPFRQVALIGALARLYHREGFWDGEWWGNQPSTEGPYFDPVQWRESPRIRSLLVGTLLSVEGAGGSTADSLISRLAREGVIPRESPALLARSRKVAPREYSSLVRLLVGGRELSSEALEHLAELARSDAELREPAVRVVIALPLPPPAATPLLSEAAADATLPAPLRAQALSALTRSHPDDPAIVAPAYASVVPALAEHPELLQAWRRYTGERARTADLEHFLAGTGSPEEGMRTVAYAVLVQLTALPRVEEEIRTRAAAAIEAAWTEPTAGAALVRAIRLLGVEDRFAEELKNYPDEEGAGAGADQPTGTESGSQSSTTSRTP